MSVREGAPVRYRARCEYDGTDFAGFQLQPNGRTVQGELETALTRLGRGERVVVDGAGRTDSGVHATGQVIAFTWTGEMQDRALEQAVNALLPRDVAIRDLRRTFLRFHPRYAARYREYRYTVWNGPRSPLHERISLELRAPLDIAAMADAGTAFLGRLDVRAFGGETNRSTVRNVQMVRVRKVGCLVTIDVRANAFLRGQVRRMVAALIEAGKGKIDKAAIEAALAAPGPAFNGAAAPARGLCLRRVVMGRRPLDDKEDEE